MVRELREIDPLDLDGVLVVRNVGTGNYYIGNSGYMYAYLCEDGKVYNLCRNGWYDTKEQAQKMLDNFNSAIRVAPVDSNDAQVPLEQPRSRRAADDFDFIRARLAEIKAEKDAAIARDRA